MSAANDYSFFRGAVTPDTARDYTAVMARCQDESTWFRPRCQKCSGTGKKQYPAWGWGAEACETCNGTGKVPHEEEA